MGQYGLDRRGVLKAGALVGAAAAIKLGMIGGIARGSMLGEVLGDDAVVRPRRRMLRLAHMTDMHIQPELRAFEGVGACLRGIQSESDRPELIVTGGDLIMDAFEHDHTRTQTLWELWTKVLKDECSLPVEHCLGNHDIWGWHKAKSGTKGDEGQWGKKWAMDVLGLARPYHSFDRSGWRMIVLDSVAPNGDGYVGRLDEEQFAWLESTLKVTPPETNILVVSHIPILSVTGISWEKEDSGETHKVPAGLVHADCGRLVKLFARHRNVRACLSGHMHEIERVDYQGVSYLCDGAVSGGWWKGRNKECDEGYALIDLFDDGSVERTYRTYGWKAAT